MDKTKRAMAVKELQTKLKDEKMAEVMRYDLMLIFRILSNRSDACRRREITMERRKAAEERKRLEEAKAQVKNFPLFCFLLSDHTQMGAKKAARLRRRAGRSKKINH